MGTAFSSPKSMVAFPGPSRIFRPAVPKVPAGFWANAAVLKYLDQRRKVFLEGGGGPLLLCAFGKPAQMK
jgi:hypothetical protein